MTLTPHLMHSTAHSFLTPRSRNLSVLGIKRVPEAGDEREATTAQTSGMGTVLGTAGSAPWGWLPAWRSCWSIPRASTSLGVPGKLLSSLNPRMCSGTELQGSISHQGFILGLCCFFLKGSLVPQRMGGDWRNLPDPWSRRLINQCLNNCRALQTFCSQWPVQGRDGVEDRAREVAHPSPSSPRPQSCSQD